MHDYAEYHFKFEEEYLSKIAFPNISEHRRLHKDFANQIYQYQRSIKDGELVLNTELVQIITDWLFSHIQKEDKKYSNYLENKK